MSYYYQKLRSAVNFGFWRTGYYSFFDPDAESSVDEGEVYDDGTAIKNISVSGVAKKAAMFEPKSGKTTPPVLRKFRGQQQMNAGGEATTKPNQPAEKPTPSWVKKPVSNGAVSNKPDILPKSPTSPLSPVSPKQPPTIPKKTVGGTHKWTPEKSPPVTSNKPSTFAKSNDSPAPNTFRKLSTDSNNDINHNVKTQPVNSNSNITTGNKRASVTDMLKSFQSDSTGSDVRINSIKPLKENVSPKPTDQSNDVVIRRTSDASSTSIQDRLAAFEKPSGKTNFASNRKSVITRKRDSASFKRIAIGKNDKSFDGSPPTKPPKLTNVDLDPIKSEFQQLQSKGGKDEEYIDEDLYDDIGNVMPQFSVIQPMTEEEEYDDVGNVMAMDETYDDCSTALPPPPIETDEVYECFDDEQTVSGGSTSSKSKESEKELAEKKKREEKERKEQEKKEKEEKKRLEKEEKERKNRLKKKEKEEKERFSKLQINGSEMKQADGRIRTDYNGTKLDLVVKAGDKVDVIRMDKNPKGKWLVKTTDGKYGYVESENVEWMNDEQEYMDPDEVDANRIQVDAKNRYR